MLEVRVSLFSFVYCDTRLSVLVHKARASPVDELAYVTYNKSCLRHPTLMALWAV